MLWSLIALWSYNMSRFIFLILISLFFLGCNNSGSSINENPLSYDLEINRSCNNRFCKPDDNEVCKTKQSFPSQAAYCEGLKDSKLNKGCARRERKSIYFSKCGPQFEDTNIEGWTVACPSGSTERSSMDLFPDRKSYCDDLSAPNHGSCSTTFRNEQSERFECGR